MKVLQVNTVCGTGSTGRIATDIYKILEKQGYESSIAYGRGSAPKDINSIKIGTDFNNYMHVAKTRLFDKHGFSSIKTTKEFIKKAKEYNPDVIHLHNIHGYFLNIELLFNYLKEVNKPVVWTLHDCWTFTGHCAYFDYVECDKWKLACNNCPQKNSYPKSLFVDNSKNNYKRKKELFTGIKNMTIVTPSKWLGELAKQSFLKEYSVSVIHNGVDLDKFKHTDSDFRAKNGLEGKFLILGVANIWDRRKGLNDFIELSRRLSSDYKIIIVGISKEQKKNLPDNIIAITRTNNIEELVEIYSAADVFVNTTYEDNFPTTNLEALACGTPVITYDTGGSVESIIDENCIIPKGNVDILVNTILEKKFKTAKFYDPNVIDINKEKCFEKYLELYKEVGENK